MKQNNHFSQTKVLRHSLSTPLTTILINTELALRSTDGKIIKKNYQYHLNQVLISARYLSSILKLANEPKKLYKQFFSPMEALQEIISIAYKPDQNIKIITHINISPNLKITGNKFYFQEALICILNNASEAYLEKHHNQSILIMAQNNKSFLEIYISDGGKGITWLEKQKINLYSYSKKKNHQGIGLNFAKQTIKNHFDGKFELISKKNKGTTVKISIPLQI